MNKTKFVGLFADSHAIAGCYGSARLTITTDMGIDLIILANNYFDLAITINNNGSTTQGMGKHGDQDDGI